MKTDNAVNILMNICDGYVDTIMTGLEEECDRLVLTKAMIEFSNSIGSYSKIDDIFISSFLDKVIKEITMYLAR